MTAIAVQGPLAPVREALLRRARADAERLLADADDEATKVLGEAWAEADERIAEARATGRADADALAGAELARARRTARGIVLATQRDAYEELRRRVIAALSTGQLRETLVTRATEVLGEGPLRVAETPDGGVTVDRGDRHVDCSLAALADHALAALAGQLPGLWDG